LATLLLGCREELARVQSMCSDVNSKMGMLEQNLVQRMDMNQSVRDAQSQVSQSIYLYAPCTHIAPGLCQYRHL
jgi:hypothetical protein